MKKMDDNTNSSHLKIAILWIMRLDHSNPPERRRLICRVESSPFRHHPQFSGSEDTFHRLDLAIVGTVVRLSGTTYKDNKIDYHHGTDHLTIEDALDELATMPLERVPSQLYQVFMDKINRIFDDS